MYNNNIQQLASLYGDFSLIAMKYYTIILWLEVLRNQFLHNNNMNICYVVRS